MKKHFFLLIVPLVMVIIWFHQGRLLAWSEEGLPFYSAIKMWSMSSSLWVPIETGIFAVDFYPRLFLAGLFVFTSYLHIPTFLFQATVFYLLMISGMYAVYYLTKGFLKEHPLQDIAAIVAAIFYFLNPYSMTQIWQRGLYAQDFMFALLPLGLLFFIIGLQKRDSRYSLLVVLISFVCATTFGLVTNIIVFWSVLLLYSVFWILTQRVKKDIFFTIFFSLLTCCLWVLVQAWWLLPLVVFKQDIFGYKASNATNNVGGLIAVSQYFPFSSVIRLIQNFYFFNPGAYGPSYGNFFMQFISWLVPVMLMTAILFIKRAKALAFFLMLLVCGLFISLGSNPPFGWLFMKLFTHISMLQSFRNPYEKYGVVVMLAYAPLFGYGLVQFSLLLERIKKQLNWKIMIPFVIFLIGGVYMWPMWADMYRPAINIPKEYATINNWFSVHGKDTNSRIFIIPFLGQGIINDWGYNGLESTLFTLNPPSLSYMLETTYTFDIFHNVYNYIGQVNEFPVISLLDGKYLLTRQDILGNNMQQLTDINTELVPVRNKVSLPFCQQKKQISAAICPLPQSLDKQLHMEYLDIVVQTNTPAALSFKLENQGSPLVQWSDPGNTEYTTEANIQKELLFPLNEPFAPIANMQNFSPQLIIQATPLMTVFAPTITIEKITLVPFMKQQIHEDTPVLTQGKLSLFRLNTTQFQQPITDLSVVKPESTFRAFFIQASEDESSLAHTGYIIAGQNNNKNISKFLTTKNYNIIHSKQLSTTRYIIQKVNSNPAILAFNETFNPQWKLLPLHSSNELQNTPLNDFQLIRSSFLPESNHIMGNGYANFWLLPAGDKSYGMIFLPQVYADFGTYITVCTTVTILLFLGISAIKKNRHEEK